MPDYHPTVRTRTLARIVGPYLLIVALALYLRLATLATFFTSFMQDEGLVFVAGAFTLMVGLTVLVAHHHWTSISAGVISLIGILATVKGAALIIAPQFGSQLTADIVETQTIMLGAIAFEAIMGLWLTFVGWRPRS